MLVTPDIDQFYVVKSICIKYAQRGVDRAYCINGLTMCSCDYMPLEIWNLDQLSIIKIVEKNNSFLRSFDKIKNCRKIMKVVFSIGTYNCCVGIEGSDVYIHEEIQIGGCAIPNLTIYKGTTFYEAYKQSIVGRIKYL